MPVFVDSNVFFYAAGSEHALKGPCVRLLQRIAVGQLDAVTSAEVIQELHHVYRRRGRVADGVALGREVARLFSAVLPVTRGDVLRSGDILTERPQLSPRDALHAATALNNGIDTILSADPDLGWVEGIRRVDPIEADRTG